MNVAEAPRTAPCEQDFKAALKYLANGITPVVTASPPLTGCPAALILPIFSPIPAFLEAYSTMAEAVALIDFNESPDSIRVQELNCFTFVRSPAIIGVGNEI